MTKLQQQKNLIANACLKHVCIFFEYNKVFQYTTWTNNNDIYLYRYIYRPSKYLLC